MNHPAFSIITKLRAAALQIHSATEFSASDFLDAAEQLELLCIQQATLLELLDQFLAIDDWNDDLIAPAELIERATNTLAQLSVSCTHPHRRLSLLTSHTGEAGNLLLESIRVTHQDILQRLESQESSERDPRTAVGDFLHKASGKRYVIAIAAYPDEMRR